MAFIKCHKFSIDLFLTKCCWQEYLESNFNPEILEELREIGADVNLIKEYSDKLRVYLKSVIKTNKQNQEKKIQVTKSLYCEVFFTKY